MFRKVLYGTVAIVALVQAMAAVAAPQIINQTAGRLVGGIQRVVGNNQGGYQAQARVVIFQGRDRGDKELKKLLGADINKNVIVDYGAKWCGICHQMEPLVTALSKDYIIYKVDVDENRAIAREQGTNRYPTFIVYENGKEVRRMIGAQSKESLTQGVKTRKAQEPQPEPKPAPDPPYDFSTNR